MHVISILYRAKFHHILTWAAYFAIWIYSGTRYTSNYTAVVGNTLVYFILHSALFYTVCYCLFPNFLYKGSYGRFILYALCSYLLICGVMATYILLVFGAAVGSPTKWVLISLGYTGVNVGLLCSGKLLIDKVRADRLASKIHGEKLNDELQYLKAQINPHFLFNAINSIHVLIKTNPGEAAETLIRLSELLRFQLYDCSHDSVTIEKEMAYLNNFIEMEKIRRGNKVDIHFSQEGTLSGFNIPPFLFVPFMENAFKFLSDGVNTPNRVAVKVTKTRNSLTASFFNTTDKQKVTQSKDGIGLKNVQRRLQLLFPSRHKLQINEEAGSFKVVMSIDLI